MSAQVILLVEDEVLIRMQLADLLREVGYEVLEAANGEEATMILATAEKLDLIVTDVRMPGSMDGIELTASAKRLCPSLPVIVFSGHLSPGAADPADLFIQKPFRENEVLSAVENLIGAACQNANQERNAL